MERVSYPHRPPVLEQLLQAVLFASYRKGKPVVSAARRSVVLNMAVLLKRLGNAARLMGTLMLSVQALRVLLLAALLVWKKLAVGVVLLTVQLN